MVGGVRGKWLVIALMALVPASISATGAEKKELCHGFLPKNDRKIPVGMFVNQGLSKQQFDNIADTIERVYSPIVAAHGGHFVVNRMWDTDEVNSSADRDDGNWNINMYGGLARHPAMTEEGYMAVACHETGHHLGMDPRYPGEWASNEGEADYFSVLKCMRFVYEGADNEGWLKTAQLDSYATSRCDEQFSDRNDQLYCYRSVAAAQSIAKVFQDLEQTPTPAQFETPDSTVVRRMNDDHPEAQCRVDTLFNGATCKVDRHVELGETGWQTGACINNVDQYGWRPLCWFKPN